MTRLWREMTPDDRRLAIEGLALPHQVDAEAHLLTRDHDLVQDLTEYLVDGQTNFQDAAVAATASASFADPGREINDGAGFKRKHMLQAWSLVTVATLPYTVKYPMFCGPLTGKADEGTTGVSVTAQDKMFLSLTDVPNDHWKAKARLVDVLREIFESTGETRFALPRGLTVRIDDEVHIGPEEEIWPAVVAQDLAGAFGFQLYYDLEGWLRLREHPEDPSMTYRADIDMARATVTDPVAASEDWVDAPNRVLLRGGHGLVVTAELPAGHDDSPESLKRGGKRWRTSEIVENDKVRKRADGVDVAERILRRDSQLHADVQFSAIAARNSRPMDVQRVVTADDSRTFVLREASLPWRSATMSIGYHKRVSKTPKRIHVTTRRRKLKKDKKK
jgi:hypothetical protein